MVPNGIKYYPLFLRLKVQVTSFRSNLDSSFKKILKKKQSDKNSNHIYLYVDYK